MFFSNILIYKCLYSEISSDISCFSLYNTQKAPFINVLIKDQNDLFAMFRFLV